MKTSCVQDNLFVWPLLLLLTVKCFFKRWQFWNHQINGSLIWSSYQKMTERDHDFLCKYRNFGWRFMKNLQRISVFGYRVECDYCVTMVKENGIKNDNRPLPVLFCFTMYCENVMIMLISRHHLLKWFIFSYKQIIIFSKS